MNAYGNGDKGFMRVLRKIAEKQILSGALQGYLAFVDGVSIGWCNCNARANFPERSGNGARLYSHAEKREKVVTCFEIAPEFRGKGVTTALLKRAADDAATEGYATIEGLPRIRGERYEWDFTGPVKLYENAGFAKTNEQGNVIIMRKDLQDEQYKI